MTQKDKFSRRNFLKTTALATGAVAAPMIFTSRKAFAEPVEINMLGWYGTAEPDMVAEFEAANNVKFVPKYYAGGDNMLAALAQNPPGTFDLIHTDAEYARLLIESELVDELDPSDYPLDDLMHDDFRLFPGHWKNGRLYSLISRQATRSENVLEVLHLAEEIPRVGVQLCSALQESGGLVPLPALP